MKKGRKIPAILALAVLMELGLSVGIISLFSLLAIKLDSSEHSYLIFLCISVATASLLSATAAACLLPLRGILSGLSCSALFCVFETVFFVLVNQSTLRQAYFLVLCLIFLTAVSGGILGANLKRRH